MTPVYYAMALALVTASNLALAAEEIPAGRFIGVSSPLGLEPGALNRSNIAPCISPDGLTLIFRRASEAPQNLWCATRPNKESLFGAELVAELDLGFLPDDVDQSGHVNIFDVTAFVNQFNGPQRLDLIDLNRSGDINVFDVTSFIAIFEGGAGGTALPPRP